MADVATVSATSFVIGVDVGGTNTDAVVVNLLDGTVAAGVKRLTTRDVTSGVRNALRAVIAEAEQTVPGGVLEKVCFVWRETI